LSDFRFKEEHVEYIKTILPDAEEGFMDYLRQVDCSLVTVKAIKEGSVVFPRVPLLTVEVFLYIKRGR
jgi:nicotinate phosphoribosyltransferase